MKILVIAEHDNKELKESTLHTLTAAFKLGGDVELLVSGFNCNSVIDFAKKIEGVNKVLMADNACYEHQLAENLSALLVSIADKYEYILAPATTFGKNFMPRVAALLDVPQVSDITGIVDNNTFLRPIYAGNAIATVKENCAKKIITVRPTAFAMAEIGGNEASVEKLDLVCDLKLSEFVGIEATKSERPELTSAKVVVSGGRGMQNKENFELIEKLADKLNAAIGASRAAVDAGFVPNDYQVGQTGKIVAPDLYIAIGISGAVQHLAGMKDSKVIVAINKDPDAPIFELADYGLVGDLFEVIPELMAEL